MLKVVAMNENLTNGGGITFTIDLKDNPPFKDLESNITFMYQYDVGGVKLTVVKEKSTMRVVVNNSKYGVARLESDISKKLSKDMRVALNWTKKSTQFYLNGESVSESIYA